MILWNSFTGAINYFDGKAEKAVLKLLSRRGFSSPDNGVAKYLHDRGYLVPEGTNEMRRVHLKFGERHYRTDVLELILMSSEDCNFRCVYCYENFKRGTMLPEVREGIKKMAERRAAEISTLRIGWFGGEPLYGWQAVEDLGPFFVELAERHGITYTSHMTTNAYLLTPEVAEKLLAWKIRTFQITIDGAAEQHDCRRVGRDGSPTFARILENLRALKQRPEQYGVAIRVNFDRESYREMEPFLQILSNDFKGDRRFSLDFHSIGAWGGPNDDALALCGAKESKEATTMLTDWAVAKGLSVDTMSMSSGAGDQVCYAGRPYHFLIGADGKIMKCTVVLDTKDYNVLGRIREDGEMSVDMDKLALWVEPAYASDRKCQKCQLVPTCQGMHCPLIRIEENRQPCPGYKNDLRSQLQGVLRARREALARQAQAAEA